MNVREEDKLWRYYTCLCVIDNHSQMVWYQWRFFSHVKPGNPALPLQELCRSCDCQSCLTILNHLGHMNVCPRWLRLQICVLIIWFWEDMMSPQSTELLDLAPHSTQFLLLGSKNVSIVIFLWSVPHLAHCHGLSWPRWLVGNTILVPFTTSIVSVAAWCFGSVCLFGIRLIPNTSISPSSHRRHAQTDSSTC